MCRAILAYGGVVAIFPERIDHDEASLQPMVHAVPYQLLKQLAKLPRNEGLKSTVKLHGCTALFTADCAALATFAGVKREPRTAAAVLAACPARGYARCASRTRSRRRRTGARLWRGAPSRHYFGLRAREP